MDLRPNGPDEGGCPLNFCNPVVGTRGKQPNKTSYSIAQQGRGMGSPRHLSTSPVLHHQIPPPNGTAAASERAASERAAPRFARQTAPVRRRIGRGGDGTARVGYERAREWRKRSRGSRRRRFQVCSLPLSSWFLSAHWPARSRAVLLFWPKLFVLTISRSKISAQIIRSSYFARLEAEILDEIFLSSADRRQRTYFTSYEVTISIHAVKIC